MKVVAFDYADKITVDLEIDGDIIHFQKPVHEMQCHSCMTAMARSNFEKFTVSEQDGEYVLTGFVCTNCWPSKVVQEGRKIAAAAETTTMPKTLFAEIGPQITEIKKERNAAKIVELIVDIFITVTKYFETKAKSIKKAAQKGLENLLTLLLIFVRKFVELQPVTAA